MHGDGRDDAATAGLETAVLRELKALRGTRGRLDLAKFSHYPTLVKVCGGDDLLDGFLMFRRELRRYATSSRDEAAAAWSILGDAETVLDRLYIALDHLDPAAERDQRTARRWGDRALPGIAAEMVLLGKNRGRLGLELLNLELHGDLTGGLRLVIDQMTLTELGARAADVSLWRYTPDGGDPKETELDLEEYPSVEVAKDTYTMRRHELAIELPDWVRDEQILQQAIAAGDGDAKILGMTITGRDAPGRTVTFACYADLGHRMVATCTSQRTVAEVSLFATRSML